MGYISNPFVRCEQRFTDPWIGRRQILREILDALDLFVGRYLVLWATAYIALKFIHFKIFPDFPPF